MNFADIKDKRFFWIAVAGAVLIVAAISGYLIFRFKLEALRKPAEKKFFTEEEVNQALESLTAPHKQAVTPLSNQTIKSLSAPSANRVNQPSYSNSIDLGNVINSLSAPPR